MTRSIAKICCDWMTFARHSQTGERVSDQIVADSYDLHYLVEDDAQKAWEAINFVIKYYPEAVLVDGENAEACYVVGLLAAGPLEDFLSAYGPQFIDRVEVEARRDRRMAWALGGVWKFTMTDEVWARVQRAAGSSSYWNRAV